MASSRGIATILALLALLLAIAVYFLHGRATPSDARAALPSSASEASLPRHDLDSPEKLADTPTRESVPIPPAVPGTRQEPTATSVSGIALDADSGVPIDAFEVVHSPTGAGGHYVDTLFGFELEQPHPSVAFAGTGGRFTLDALGSDARNVTVVAPGYEVAKIQVVEFRPNVVPEDLVFRMRRAATVRGRVIDLVSGAPVEGALIAWVDDGGQARNGAKERFERTDALGRFLLDTVPAGPRRLLAGREDLGEAFTPPMELEPGVVAQEVVIELGRTSSK